MLAQYLQFLAGLGLFALACVAIRVAIDAACDRPTRPAQDDEDGRDTEVIDFYV